MPCWHRDDFRRNDWTYGTFNFHFLGVEVDGRLMNGDCRLRFPAVSRSMLRLMVRLGIRLLIQLLHLRARILGGLRMLLLLIAAVRNSWPIPSQQQKPDFSSGVHRHGLQLEVTR